MAIKFPRKADPYFPSRSDQLVTAGDDRVTVGDGSDAVYRLSGLYGGSVRGIESLSVSICSCDDRIMTGTTDLGNQITAGGGNDILTVASGFDTIVAGNGLNTLDGQYDQLETDRYHENNNGMRLRDRDAATGVNLAGIERLVITTGIFDTALRVGSIDRISGWLGIRSGWMMPFSRGSTWANWPSRQLPPMRRGADR